MSNQVPVNPVAGYQQQRSLLSSNKRKHSDSPDSVPPPGSSPASADPAPHNCFICQNNLGGVCRSCKASLNENDQLQSKNAIIPTCVIVRNNVECMECHCRFHYHCVDQWVRLRNTCPVQVDGVHLLTVAGCSRS